MWFIGLPNTTLKVTVTISPKYGDLSTFERQVQSLNVTDLTGKNFYNKNGFYLHNMTTADRQLNGLYTITIKDIQHSRTWVYFLKQQL